MLTLALIIACTVEPVDRTPGASALIFTGAAPHNVLMISIDTLRRDRLGRYGGGDATPFLDGLLAEGVALDDHRSCSTWTYPSAVCALTGRDLVLAGFAPQRLPDGAIPAVPTELHTLAEQLWARGYETGLVTGNSFLGEFTHADRGHRLSTTIGLADAEQIEASGLETWDELNATGAPRPWFLHLHFMDPHMPYTPPEAYLVGLDALEPIPYDLSQQSGYDQATEDWDSLSEVEQALLLAHAAIHYGGELRYLDDQLEGLFEALDDRGALDDTLVVLWSDHGEQFWDHGEVAHGNAVYSEEIAAVAGFWARGLEPRAWSGATAHEDLLPTILSALGLPVPGDIDGRVIGATDAPTGPRYALSFGFEQDTTSQAVDRDGLALIYHWSGTLERYDLGADPGEHEDHFTPNDPQVRDLWSLLEPRVRAVCATADQPQPAWPEL